MFERRHYEVVVDTIKDLGFKPTREEVMLAFERCFRKDNPNFEPVRFWKRFKS